MSPSPLYISIPPTSPDSQTAGLGQPTSDNDPENDTPDLGAGAVDDTNVPGLGHSGEADDRGELGLDGSTIDQVEEATEAQR